MYKIEKNNKLELWNHKYFHISKYKKFLLLTNKKDLRKQTFRDCLKKLKNFEIFKIFRNISSREEAYILDNIIYK